MATQEEAGTALLDAITLLAREAGKSTVVANHAQEFAEAVKSLAEAWQLVKPDTRPRGSRTSTATVL